MRYKVLQSCVAGGRARRMGSIIELSDLEARDLMSIGRVAPHDEPAPEENRALGFDEVTKPRRRALAKKVED